MWWIIVTGIIALVAVILILMWFTSSGGRIFGGVGNQLDQLGDCDNDNAANMFDQCPCIPAGAREDPQNAGCPNDGRGPLKCGEQDSPTAEQICPILK